jgi:dipeptidyl aminopeptidase/acylaminoacyl peptidase
MTGLLHRTVAVLCLAAAASGAPRPITETDLYSFRWVADPRVSPGGEARVVFTQVSVNARRDGYNTALWIVPLSGGAPRQLTAGPHDSSPRWSPDGKRIAFLRAVERDGRPQPPQLFLLSMEGGEGRQITDLPKGVSNPVWSPDGRTIAFSSTTTGADLKPKEPNAPEPSDVRVITRASYRMNSSGYLQFDRPAHIWTVPAGDTIAKAAQITSGEFAASEFLWSRDGSELIYTTNRDEDPAYRLPSVEVWSAPAGGGPPRRIAALDGRAGGLSLSPDGRRLAFVSSLNQPVRSYSQPDLFVLELAPGSSARNLTAEYDFDIAAGLAGDQHPPRGNARSNPQWSADGRYVYTVATEEGRANLVRVEARSGKVEKVTNATHEVYAFDFAPGQPQGIAAIATPTRIGDLFTVDLESGQSTPTTDVNRALFSELKLSEPEMIWYKSFDGRRIQAWVQGPPDWDRSRKYPLILNIHGGPHAAYGYTFSHEFQWMAAKGYLVLYPNPRGSTSYGQEFGNIIQYRYPGDDHKDLMAGVDELIARGWADPDRLGITGGSGGGLLTNWAITQTDRFKAAVSQRSIADWRDFWYTADFTLFHPTWFRDAPWKEEADFKARSPITYVEKITTPLMLIEGEADLRTPPGAGGEQMFRALKYLKRPVVMVQFPGESHELSRSGKPRHRVERLQHILSWFDKYLIPPRT